MVWGRGVGAAAAVLAALVALTHGCIPDELTVAADGGPTDDGTTEMLPGPPDAPASDATMDRSPFDVWAEASKDGPLTDVPFDSGCEAGLSPCGGVCVDTSTSATNCGTCGHGCLLGTCSGGVCQAYTLASGINNPTGIAVDSTSVYVTDESAGNGSKVTRIAIAGGAVQAIVSGSGLVNPHSIAVDVSHVYFVENSPTGGAWRADLSGANLTAYHNPDTSPWDVAIDAANVYWTQNTATGGVVSCPLAGCGGGTPNVLVLGRNGSSGIAVGGGSFFWVDFNGGTVMTCPTTGCGGNPTQLLDMQGGPLRIVVDANYAYWTNTTSGEVKRCKTTGCGGVADTIASMQAGASGIAVDASGLYWAATGAGTVAACPAAGCTGGPRTLATGQSAPTGIALDAVSVYWTNPPAGTVMRVAK